VICLLLAIGLVVGLVLWATIRPDGPDSAGQTTVIPTTTPTTTLAAPSSAAGAIASLQAYDPGGDRHENDDLAAAALADGNPATNWQTECYGDRYFGKEGVGLVVDLAAPAAGTLSFDVTTAPFQLFAYATDDAVVPADIDGWGQPIESKFVGEQPSTVVVTVGTPARHVLIWFVEGGISPTCSTEHPHRAVVGEVTFTGSG
jgi:hypothetical protein